MAMSCNEPTIIISIGLIPNELPKVDPCMIIRAVRSQVSVRAIWGQTDIQIANVARRIDVGLETVESIGTSGAAVGGVESERSTARSW